jgi:hypothetical protein
MIGPEVIQINDLVSCLAATSLISSTSLRASLMQVCQMRFIMDGWPIIFSGVFDCFGGILVICLRPTCGACQTPSISILSVLAGWVINVYILLHFTDYCFVYFSFQAFSSKKLLLQYGHPFPRIYNIFIDLLFWSIIIRSLIGLLS